MLFIVSSQWSFFGLTYRAYPPYVVTEPSVVPFPLSDKIKKMDTVVSERHWRAGCNACHGHVLESDIQPLCSCCCCCCKRRNASTCLTIRAVSQQVSLPTAAVVGGGGNGTFFGRGPTEVGGRCYVPNEFRVTRKTAWPVRFAEKKRGSKLRFEPEEKKIDSSQKRKFRVFFRASGKKGPFGSPPTHTHNHTHGWCLVAA